MEATHPPAPAPTAEKPSGPVVAAVLSAGIGTFVLGVFTTLGEASTKIHDFLAFSEKVGPLSGKTIFAVIAFVVAWIVLGTALRDKEIDLKPVITITLVLLALGLIGTFPTFFMAFASE